MPEGEENVELQLFCFFRMPSAQGTKQSIFEAVVTKLYVSNSSSAKYLIVAPEPHKDW